MGLASRIRNAIARGISEKIWSVGGLLRERRNLPRDPESFRRVDPYVGVGAARWRFPESLRDLFRTRWFQVRRHQAASDEQNAVGLFGDRDA